MWTTSKDLTDNNRPKPPRDILIDNKITTSLNKISNYSKKVFIDKIKKLRDKFKVNYAANPIEILNFLLTRNKNTL